MRFRPVLFVGLGRYGCEIARRICTTVREANPEAAPIVALMEIRDDGVVVVDDAGAGEVEALRLKFVEAATYAARFDAIAAEEQALARVFVRIVNGLHQRRVQQILEERGTLVDRRTAVYFVAPLCDDVGSTALIAFIELFNRLVATRLIGQELHRTVLGFFPDLFADFRDADERFARTYVCLQELEFIAAATEQSLFEFTYLFTAKNEENQDIGSHEDLALALGEALSLVLRSDIAKDASFGSVFLNRDAYQAVTRYSSLGTSKLVFPRREVCRALDGHFAATVLREIGIGSEERVDRQIASSDVRKVVFDMHLLDVEEQLANTADGRHIWTPFHTTLAKNTVAMQVDDIFAQIATDAEEYEKQDVTRMTREISVRRMHLAAVHNEHLRKTLAERIDHRLIEAEAFLDVFLNIQGEATTGDVIDAGVTIDDVDRNARKFFDELCGIKRKQLATLQQEILSKGMALQQHDAERKAREAAGTVAAPDPDEKALETVISATTKELSEKQKQYAQLRETIATHDRQMKDGAYRRTLLQRQRDKAEDAAAELAAELQQADQDWRGKRAALAEERRRGKTTIIKAGAIAAGLLVLYAIAAYVLHQKSTLEEHLLWKIGGWSAVVAIVCVIVVAIRVALRWQGAKARLYLAAQRKHNVTLSIVEKHRDAFRAVYNFGVHGASIDWATDFCEAGKKLREDLRAFRTALQALLDEERKAYDEVEFAQTLFRRSILVPSEIGYFVECAERYEREKNRFRTAHPLSGEFAAFGSSRGLDHLVQDLRDASAEVFAHIQKLTIEKLLADHEAGGRLNIAEKLQQLFRYSAPLVQLHVETGEDNAQPIRYFGTSDGDSPFADVVKRIGQEARQYSSGKDTEITAVTIKAGFPAHHVALIVHCDFVIEQQKDKVQFQVVPDWTLEPLVPSELLLGAEDDAARQLACESLALGVVTETPEGLVMDGTVIGPSYRAIIELLRSLRGFGLKGKLQVKTAERLAEKGAAEKLGDFLAKGSGDRIDQRIIQSALDRLDESASV